MTAGMTATERLIAKDRGITIAGLVILAALSWAYVLAGGGTGMSVLNMSMFAFPPPPAPVMAMEWGAGYWGIMVIMWWIMMIAMMVPSAAPMVLLYARVARNAQSKGQMNEGPLPVPEFVGGYLAVWFAFSLAATLLQWGLEKLGLVHQMLMWSTNSVLTGIILLIAGIYQLTPLKTACLEHCRSPAAYLSQQWRNGRSGAFMIGINHGAYCLGCCWALMALLFAGGIMNLVWIAGLAIVVLVEKVAPAGHRFSQALAALMIGAGSWLLLRELLPA